MSDELKPCPFCGGEANVDTGYEIDGILCDGCGFWYRFDGYTDSKDAIDFWNTRPVDQLRAERDRLRQVLVAVATRLESAADDRTFPHGMYYTYAARDLAQIRRVIAIALGEVQSD